MLFLAALSFSLGVFVFASPPNPDDPPWAANGLGSFLVLLGFSCMGYAANELVRRIVLTGDSLVEKDLRGTRVVPLSEIRGISLAHHYHAYWSARVVRVSGDRHRISFTSSMKGYAPLLEAILRQGPNAHLVDGSEAPESEEGRRSWERRRRRVVWSLAAIPALIGGLLVGRSGFLLSQQSRLDREGKIANGRVVAATHNLVQFRFEAEGRNLLGRSPVMEGEFESARSGDPVQVVYLPGNPAICRIETTLSHRRALILMSLGIGMFLLIPIVLQKPR